MSSPGRLLRWWLAFLPALAIASSPARPPNVVLIYGDDVGYADVGIYGAEKIPTPHIDRLAREGLRFTDGHSSSATCTPSRYSLLTGDAAFRYEGTGILPGDARLAVPVDAFTLPDLFQQAGYVTGAIGKWHLGLGDGTAPIDWNGEIAPGPLDIGFDYNYILPATNDRVPCVYLRNRRVVNLDPNDPITVSYQTKLDATYPDGRDQPEAMTVYPSTHGHNFSVINGIGRIGWMSGGRSALWDDETMSDELLKEARAFITRHRDRPFFLYYAAQNIHVPRVPHPRFRGRSGLSWRGDSMVELDWVTGEIIAELEALGLRDNTIIIFTSDNGPVYDDGYADDTTVERSWEEVDRGHDASGIHRGGKYQIYEGGTRVPLIVNWPGRIEPGISDALVSQLDFLASFGELLDIPLPAEAGFDSRPRIDVLLGHDREAQGVILEQAFADVSLRWGPYKYIPARTDRLTRQPLPTELYDLTQSPDERRNLATARPRLTERAARLFDQLIEQGTARTTTPDLP